MRYTDSHVFGLVTGRDFFHDYDLSYALDGQLREAWGVPRLRALAVECAARRHRDGRSAVLPVAWWEFDSPEPRDAAADELTQLRDMQRRGLLKGVVLP